ncbi:hypothetical protein AAF712_003987 [Marasmius tenuissimus]|uniref:Uncharacterized protein n=1 Tax=Marasmius tenuissimus TaxID=585030 RepID=A0ABR3A7P1_9AGAR
MTSRGPKKETIVDLDILISAKHIEETRRRKREARVYGFGLARSSSLSFAHLPGEPDGSLAMRRVRRGSLKEPPSNVYEPPSPSGTDDSIHGRTKWPSEASTCCGSDEFPPKKRPSSLEDATSLTTPEEHNNKHDSLQPLNIGGLLDEFPPPPSFSSISSARKVPVLTLPKFDSSLL